MALNTIFSGYYRAHSAIIGNSLCVGNGSVSGVTYITPAGGTTSNYLLNGSKAIFNLDPGSTVIFAELVIASRWFYAPGGTFTFKTPTSTNTLPFSALESDGWYASHTNVTSLVSAGGTGTYEVDAVNCDVMSTLWYIYVVYTKPSYPYKYIYYARGVQGITDTNTPLTFPLNNVYTPASGPVQSYALLASTGGDTIDFATLKLNGTLVGNPSVGTWNGFSPYNPSSNIQPGIICKADTNYPASIGFLDTTGTFGSANNNPYNGFMPNPNRAWCDITGMDVSYALANNINSVDVEFNIGGSPAGFLLNSLALEITAVLAPTKTVDKTLSNCGDIITYTVGLENVATVPYTNVQIVDTIPSGTSFVANSLTLNGITIPGSPLPPAGINIGTIPVASSSTITFQVQVGSQIPSPNPIGNKAMVTFTTNTAPQTLYTSIANTTITSALLTSSKIANPYSSVGATLTYTIPITNTGNTTAINVHLLDTIPSGTTLISGSFKQDGILISGSPNPPGATLPNLIGTGLTSTVTFQVTVITIPTSNPIQNAASLIFQYTVDNTTVPNIVGSGSSNTNLISTFVNTAFVNLYKNVDKYFVQCGDILTYTITIPNTGNTTAYNVVVADTVPNGTSFVTNSVTVNGNPVGGTPNSIFVGTIPVGNTSTVTFKVQINC